MFLFCRQRSISAYLCSLISKSAIDLAQELKLDSIPRKTNSELTFLLQSKGKCPSQDT